MGSMIFGYARVSSQDQELARQIDALEKYGVDEIFTKKMTGTKANRPELNRLKDKVRPGDTVVIESLSRLGRSTKDLLSLIEDWDHQGVKLVSLKEAIDTTTPTGKLLLTVLSAISQFCAQFVNVVYTAGKALTSHDIQFNFSVRNKSCCFIDKYILSTLFQLYPKSLFFSLESFDIPCVFAAFCTYKNS